QRVNGGRANAKLVSQATVRGNQQFAESSNIFFVHRAYRVLNPYRLTRDMQKCHSLWLGESVRALHGRSSVERSAIGRQTEQLKSAHSCRPALGVSCTDCAVLLRMRQA